MSILREATDPLFPSEIADLLNLELGAEAAFTTMEIALRLQSLSEHVEQTPDGRWTLKRFLRRTTTSRKRSPATKWWKPPWANRTLCW